jgi:hypothetical protein
MHNLSIEITGTEALPCKTGRLLHQSKAGGWYKQAVSETAEAFRRSVRASPETPSTAGRALVTNTFPNKRRFLDTQKRKNTNLIPCRSSCLLNSYRVQHVFTQCNSTSGSAFVCLPCYALACYDVPACHDKLLSSCVPRSIFLLALWQKCRIDSSPPYTGTHHILPYRVSLLF